METMEAITKARKLLENLTPMTGDCGQICSASCCAPMEGEETGMLLFPGEESLYDGKEDFLLKKADAGTLLICNGRCDRADRPLSCRIFPLLPVLRNDGIHVATDERARAVCPLARQGKSAMREDFLSAVLEAGNLLASDSACRAFLQELTLNQDTLQNLRKRLQN